MLKIAGPLAALTLLVAMPATAGPLENLERERANLIAIMLDPGLDPTLRAQRLQAALPRLRDLERIVIEDDQLIGRNTPTVRRAFANYDLTFLVHAAAETERSAIEQWFDLIGVSSASLANARLGRR